MGGKVVLTQVYSHPGQLGQAKQGLEECLDPLVLRHTDPVLGEVEGAQGAHLDARVGLETVGECSGEPTGAQVAAGEVQLCQRPLPKQTLEVVLHGRGGHEVYVEVETRDMERGVHGAEVESQLVVHAGAGAHSVRRDVVVPLLQQDLE